MSTTFRPAVALLDIRRILLTPAQEAIVARALGVAPDDYAPDVAAARIAGIATTLPDLSDDDRQAVAAAVEARTTWTFFPAYGLPATLSPETTPAGVQETNLSIFRANPLLRAIGVAEDDLPCGTMDATVMLDRLEQGTFPGIEDAAERVRRVALDARERGVEVFWG